MKSNQKEPQQKGEKKPTLKSKIVVLLQQRSDVTRHKLIELLGYEPYSRQAIVVDMALTELRKAGYRIFPLRGPGTPLRIANTAVESEKYINHRRKIFLPTITGMIISEHEIGQQYKELKDKPAELNKILNNATDEV
jgi:hypothetical protein